MKSLDIYIKEMLDSHKPIEYDYLDQQVYEHCLIHYKFNYLLPSEYTIYESTGAFPGQHEMVQRIKKECENNNFQTTIIKFDNNIVDELHIYFRTDNDVNIHGEYKQIDKAFKKAKDYNIVRWNKDKKQFRFAEITIFNYEKDPDGFEEMLYHETKHMWFDYQEALNKGKFLLDKQINSLEFKYRKHPNEFIKQLTYYSEDYEISAYIAQINGTLKSKKFDNIQSALDEIIKKCPTYNNYKEYYYAINDKTILNFLKKHLSDKEINKICKNIKNAWRKIINHTYHICGEHLNESRLAPSNRKFINIKDMIL